MGCIYMRTSPSGKSYIGLTTQTEQMRWEQHCSKAFNPKSDEYYSKLGKAIRKYGKNNFKVTILEECANEILPKREMYWINHYDTYFNGYNETRGGEGYWKYTTESMMELWNQGCHKKEIAKIIGCDEKTVRNHLKPLISKQEGYLRGQAYKSLSPEQSKIVLDLWEQGYNINQIQKITNISCPTISKHLKLKNVSEEDIKIRGHKTVEHSNSKPIIQYNEEGDEIQQYASIAEASSKLNINAITIKNIIKGTSKRYSNIFLKFKEES